MIRSKTGVSVNELGDQYVLLGPYKEFHARQEVTSTTEQYFSLRDRIELKIIPQR